MVKNENCTKQRTFECRNAEQCWVWFLMLEIFLLRHIFIFILMRSLNAEKKEEEKA